LPQAEVRGAEGWVGRAFRVGGVGKEEGGAGWGRSVGGDEGERVVGGGAMSSIAMRNQLLGKCKELMCTPPAKLMEDLAKTESEEEALEYLDLNGQSLGMHKRPLDYLQLFAVCNTLEDSRVRTLDLQYNKIDDSGAAKVAAVVSNGVLQTLRLQGNEIGAPGIDALVKALNSETSVLKVLLLRGNPLGRVAGEALGRMLCGNKMLQELDVSDCDIECVAVTAVFAALMDHNRTLRSLSIDNPRLHSVMQETIMMAGDMLIRNKNLSALSLAKNGIDDAGLHILVEGMVRNHGLRNLGLRSNKITIMGGPSIARMLRSSTSLVKLDLSGNRLRDGGAADIAAALEDNASLIELDLSFNAIGDLGLTALATGIKRSSSLQTFYLWGNEFGVASATAFYNLMLKGDYNTDVRAYKVDDSIQIAKEFDSL